MIGWLPVLLAALIVLGAAIALAHISLLSWRSITQSNQDRQHDALRIELPILLILSPLVLFSSPFTVAAISIVLLLWWARRITRGYFLPRTPLDWPIALMMVMVPISLLVTFDIGVSLGKVALLIYGVALYYAIVDWASSYSKLNLSVMLYLVAGGLLALLGLIGTNWQYKIAGLTEIVERLPQIAQRLSRDQTGFHPNIVAGALLWMAPPLLSITWFAWRIPGSHSYRGWAARVGLFLLLLLTMGTLILTQSRSALVAASVGILLLIWLALPRLRILLATLVVASGIAGAIAVSAQILDRINNPVSVISSLPYDPDSLTVRLDVWRSALNGIAEYPFTGIGMDTFRQLMPVRYPAASVPDSYDIGHAHNQFLQAALDLGLPGLVGYLALWIVAAALVIKSYRAQGNGHTWQRALSAGIGAALLASFLHGMTDTVALVSKPGIFFWALLAINTSLWLNIERASHNNPPPLTTLPTHPIIEPEPTTRNS